MKYYKVGFTVNAIDQLEAIELYIGEQGNPEAGARYIAAIVAQCRKLDTFPLRGTPRDDLMLGLRTISFERRVVIGYTVADEAVWIVGVSYGGRELAEAFGAD